MEHIGTGHSVPAKLTRVKRFSNFQPMSLDIAAVISQETIYRKLSIYIVAINRLAPVEAKDGTDRRQAAQCSETDPSNWGPHTIASQLVADPTLQWGRQNRLGGGDTTARERIARHGHLTEHGLSSFCWRSTSIPFPHMHASPLYYAKRLSQQPEPASRSALLAANSKHNEQNMLNRRISLRLN
jgi:hypothetical protein